MKILFPGLIFSQTSLENTERPFSFSHILIFAYWLLLKGPQATKGYEQNNIFHVFPFCLKQNKNIDLEGFQGEKTCKITVPKWYMWM